jgi:thiosulfate/3-mercaptopyruvate sulfurtransferase
MPFANPQYLVQTDWLAEHLNDPNLRVFDCTVFLRSDKDRGFRIESGREEWAESHIPGSGFVDLANDLSDQDATLRFTMPSAAQFAEAIGSYGISNDSHVILYDRAGAMWAARIWWMLRAMGFDNAALLNGGWKKWRDEGRAVSADAPTYPATTFTAALREGLIAAQPDVLTGIDDGATCIVNALSEEQHAGTVSPYGRPGHIASSVNVPAMGAGGVIDAETGAYKSAAELQSMFASAGALDAGRVITYCGGGIAASSDAFVLTLLGHENVAVYDASLSEWAADPALPMTNPVEA